MNQACFLVASFALFLGYVIAIPTSHEHVLHRVRRGHGGSGLSSIGQGATVVDGLAVKAVSTGNNNFVSGYSASQNFLASSGRGNYLGQQGGLQAAAWAGGAAANAGFTYDHIATGKYLPSNVAGYQGFPSYG